MLGYMRLLGYSNNFQVSLGDVNNYGHVRSCLECSDTCCQ
jgi:hypothetical protein